MAERETFQIHCTPEFRLRLESAAANLNLSVSAYILYLYERARVGKDADRLDRHVREVFGRHGELMRRLAK
jgi:hypothetical protein